MMCHSLVPQASRKATTGSVTDAFLLYFNNRLKFPPNQPLRTQGLFIKENA